jgi:hypothetical protein
MGLPLQKVRLFETLCHTINGEMREGRRQASERAILGLER